MNSSIHSNPYIAVIGLGYVGLPLAVEFGKKYQTVGYETNLNRLHDLKNGEDKTNQITAAEIKNANTLTFSADINDIKNETQYVHTCLCFGIHIYIYTYIYI